MPTRWRGGRSRWQILIPGRKRPKRPNHEVFIISRYHELHAEFWISEVASIEGLRVSEAWTRHPWFQEL